MHNLIISSSSLQWLSDRKKRQLQKQDVGELSTTASASHTARECISTGLACLLLVFFRHPAQDWAHPGLWDAHSVHLYQSVQGRSVHPSSRWDGHSAANLPFEWDARLIMISCELAAMNILSIHFRHLQTQGPLLRHLPVVPEVWALSWFRW